MILINSLNSESSGHSIGFGHFPGNQQYICLLVDMNYVAS